ncbi:MAG: hypothetical protein J6C37_10260 [Roseburia sp.]|nr:hypothetical protein [Roseburia sp.]
MTINTILTIVLIVATLILVGVGIYFYFRDKSLGEIRAEVYQLFLKAEHNPEFAESGKQKMKWVLSRARMLLPNWIQVFITDVFLEKIVQGWFDAVKDLLDDGKLNKSNKEVESGE